MFVIRRLIPLAVAVLTAVGCGSATTPAAGPLNGYSGPAFMARARQVVADWSKSPISRAWRTGLVLFSADEVVSIPSDAGFASQQQKETLAAGRFRLAGRLPAATLPPVVRWASGATRAVPVLSAAATFRALATGGACAVPPCGELTVTGARPSVLTLRTNGGTATVPAWQFTVAELSFPVTRAALAPGSYGSLPVWPFGTGVSGVSGGGRVLTLVVDTGACVSGWGGLKYETSSAVVVGSWSRGSAGDVVCSANGVGRYARVGLARSLGDRVILDAGSGLPVWPRSLGW